MPAPYGLTTTGFNPKSLDEVKTELESAFKLIFGAGINLEPQSNFSQLIGIIADREADLWQVATEVYASFDPRYASGAALDSRAQLRAITRQAATKTLVTLTLTGTVAAVIPLGTLVETTSGNQFELIANATIGGGGTVSAGFQAVEFGAVPAYAGTVTVITTPVAGLTSVTNPLDHTSIGRDAETDASLRQRMLDATPNGGRFVASIRNNVLAVSGVTDCYVFENDTDATDSQGLPPHSMMAVTRGGDSTDIANAILEFKAEGIPTHGSTTVSVTDSQGFPVDVKFSEATVLDVYVDVSVIVNPALFPTDGAAQIKQAIADFGDANYKIATSVIASALIPIIYGIPGVLQVNMPEIGLASNPTTSTTIVPDYTEYAELDTTRITVVVA